jgi:hypothetical protein
VGSKDIFIAAHHESNEGRQDGIVVLQQSGRSFRAVWNMVDLYSFRGIEVTDFDDDGMHEVVIKDESSGTGGGSKRLTVFSHKYSKAFALTESHMWQDLAGPLMPTVEFEGSPSKEFMKAFERYASQRDFLQAPPIIDWNSPAYAIARWHRDHREKANCRITITRYKGNPLDGSRSAAEILRDVHTRDAKTSSTASVLETDDAAWLSYFKGPLVCFKKKSEEWFIVYCPVISYEWVTSIAFDGKRIWFSIHSGGVMFSYDPNIQMLLRHDLMNGHVIEPDADLTFQKGRLYVGAKLSLTEAQLEEACQSKMTQIIGFRV